MTRLRVALVAGTLGRGGAEKQFVHMAEALASAGAELRTYCLTRGEHHEESLAALGLRPVWIGRIGSPPARSMRLAASLAGFRPHIVQAGHFFVNPHVTIAGRLAGAAPIGAIRSDLDAALRSTGRWGRLSLRVPPDIITNSWSARGKAEESGRDPASIHLVPNVLDLERFDAEAGITAGTSAGVNTLTDLIGPEAAAGPVAAMVGSLRQVKRADRFLHGLALARARQPQLSGIIVGDGPERAGLEALARDLGLSAGGVRFLGERGDVPALLTRASYLVLTSDNEGLPNVILEAMAASIPVITMPCGDAPRLVSDDRTGFVVPFEDLPRLADRMETLAASAKLRARMGSAGRKAVEALHGQSALAGRLTEVYRTIASRGRRTRLAAALT